MIFSFTINFISFRTFRGHLFHKTLVENIFGKQSILNSSCIMQFITHFEIDWLSCKKLCNIICTVIIFSSHAQHNLRGKKRLRKKWTETHLLQGNSNWRWCEKMKPIQSSSFFSFSFFLAKKYVSLSTCITVKNILTETFYGFHYVPDVYYVFRYLILFIVNEIIQA